jgi:hypothetical protein
MSRKRKSLPFERAAFKASMIGAIFMKFGRAPAMRSMRFMSVVSCEVDTIRMVIYALHSEPWPVRQQKRQQHEAGQFRRVPRECPRFHSRCAEVMAGHMREKGKMVEKSGGMQDPAFCLLLFDQTPPLFLNTALGGLNDEQLNALLQLGIA